MNTGERLWWVPVGDTPQTVLDHPALEGVDLSRTGSGASSIQMVAGDLLYATEGSSGPSVLNAYDKVTGEHVGEIEVPSPGQYGMMTYMHEGNQFVVMQVGRPGRLVALSLPQ